MTALIIPTRTHPRRPPAPPEVARLERATDQRRRAVIQSLRGEEVVSDRLRRHLSDLAMIHYHRRTGRSGGLELAFARTGPLPDSCA